MGRQAAPPVVEPELSLDDVVVMSPQEAVAGLREFCATNHIRITARDAAFDLFERAAKCPGQPVIVPTRQSTDQTVATHECMQAITDSPVASEMAARAFDIAPGSRFVHDMRDDACVLVNECTNAV